MALGITGPFETWKEGIPYACLRGDIEKVAGLTVYEPDDGTVHETLRSRCLFPLCGSGVSARGRWGR
jgi:hypothetical protein